MDKGCVDGVGWVKFYVIISEFLDVFGFNFLEDLLKFVDLVIDELD